MFNISRVSALKWSGLIGSILLGGVTIAKGDVNTGLGIIMAAFSSGSALAK